MKAKLYPVMLTERQLQAAHIACSNYTVGGTRWKLQQRAQGQAASAIQDRLIYLKREKDNEGEAMTIALGEKDARVREVLQDLIDDAKLDAAESHKEDRNSYGAGYDAGYLAALLKVAALTPAAPEGKGPVAFGRVIEGKAITISLERTPANDEPLYAHPRSIDREAIRLGDIVRFADDSRWFHEWHGVELKVVSLCIEPNGKQWASVIEGKPRHRGNGVYDSETTDIEVSVLSLIRRGE